MNLRRPATDAIYLDYNATAPVKPQVIEAIADALAMTGNPSSVHQFGRAAREAVEEARERVAAMIGATAAEIIFTAGGTEANNTALAGAGRRRLIVSEIEHPSILRAGETLSQNSSAGGERELRVLPVDGDGVVSLEALDQALGEGGEDALVSIMLANNETGVIQPVGEIATLAHARGALVHCDAVQAPGRIAFGVDSLGVDMLSLSAHKFGGPKGVGALFLRAGVDLKALVAGGGQERGWRAGTENVPGIVGFGTAAQLAAEDLQNAPHVAALRDSVEQRLRAIDPEVRIFSAGAARLPNTSCISMPGVQSETQVMGLDLSGVAVSAGSACSSGKVEPSHVLRALGAPDAETGCAIRISFGWASREADVEKLVSAWRAFYAGLSARYTGGVSQSPDGAGAGAVER
ncbi:MAG: cysteine desulfurase [Rhodospirillaceae bacterium]|jgi:cysteine desulfurase|nr:cysteine desulfurase [Rhodospirillaceae bacterium]MBT5674435.1 cysteine desulfurase [Rhodospirillaceae bacterium]MBT5778132.1 cysteine desulfurase [Rhodospirillaceae bacterium]